MPGANPMVTIAIPTFNRATWLRDCVRVALTQSYRRFEVLVSDNASSDETAMVLDQFSDERLRVVRQPRNIGATANWNACLAEARGAKRAASDIMEMTAALYHAASARRIQRDNTDLAGCCFLRR